MTVDNNTMSWDNVAFEEIVDVAGVKVKKFSDGILKPELDDRTYAILTLPNALQVLLVSDPTTDKAAAALDVHVGSLCDADDVAGLAHFCEHLLFMGTEKYPEENEYSQYLAKHGGSSNAFTGADHTNYYFDVSAEYLEGALDRFTQFFVSPLFLDSCTEREMKAVDSEHKKNIQADGWRIHQLQKDLSAPDHPYCKFGTGNLVTLKDIPESKGIDIRKVLLDFHSKYYSSNIMKMVVVGKESIDQLATWVVEKTAAIKNLNIPVPNFPGHPLSKPFLETEILIKPVKDLRNLEIVFPLPELALQYRCGPGSYVSHLVGHESEGSILALLKAKGWAQDLGASSSRGATNFDFFKISIGLTEEGSKHTDEIIVIVFQYLEMIRAAGVQEWIYNECKTVSQVYFRFMEKSNPSGYASRLSGSMHKYPAEHVLAGSSMLFEMDKGQIEDVLNRLNVENFRITLVSPDFNTEGWNKAEWYGTEYLARPISDSLKNALRNLTVIPELHLPNPNEFIPTNLSIRKTSEQRETRPTIIRDTATMRLWHKKDDTFWVPKAKVSLMLKSPLAYVTPRCSVMSKLYSDLLDDALNEFSYYAHVAGLSFSIDNTTEGIELGLFGYNDKLSNLLHRIIMTIKTLQIKPDRFKAIKEQLTRNYKNWTMEQPYQHATYFVSYITQEKLWSSEEKLEVLKDITAEEIQNFYPYLISQMHVEALVHGNVEADDALKLADIVDTELKAGILPPQSRDQVVRTLIIPEGKKITHTRDVYNPDQPNSAIEYNIQIGDITDDDVRVKSLLFSQVVREPCFNVLRTKEQLGYIVFSSVRKQTGMIGLMIIVQSEKPPVYLEERIVAFLSSMRTTLSEMTDAEFEKHKAALAFKLLETDKNLYQEASRLWRHIQSRYYDFHQNERDAVMVKSITKDALVEFFDRRISPSSSTLRKLSVHMQSRMAKEVDGVAAANSDEISIGKDGVAEFKLASEFGKGPRHAKTIGELSIRERGGVVSKI
ncbi:Insulinase (Peptidase M16) [Blyttiomyces sp. JEL0837]|nr:Insulinase (Peptidase M16) [Blyttiomyces sp. JEL0837]